MLIAGAYTPIAVSIGGILGVIIISAAWFVAVFGIILSVIDLKKFAKFSMICYIAMGRAAVVAIKLILSNFFGDQVSVNAFYWGDNIYCRCHYIRQREKLNIRILYGIYLFWAEAYSILY